VANQDDKLKKDFAEQYQQAKEDIETLESILNKIWESLIKDILSEFYSTEKTSLRDMFNIEFSAAGPIILDTKSDPQIAKLQYPTTSSGTYNTAGTATIYSSNDNPD